MEDISLHILDIAENAVSSGASLITITVEDDAGGDRFSVRIEDNGRGMTAEFAQKAADPFCTTRTTRKVGLGLPFLAQAAEETGGSLTIGSEPGRGTIIVACFRPGHIDMKPLGNIADTIISLVAARPDVDVSFRYVKDGRIYELDTRPLREALGGIPMNSSSVLSALRDDIRDGMNDILNEPPEIPAAEAKNDDPV